MRRSRRLALFFLGGCFAALGVGVGLADEKRIGDFREVLELAGVGPEVLAELGVGPRYEDADWRTLFRVLKRFEQFGDSRASTADLWLGEGEERLGDIFEVEGRVVLVERISLSEAVAKLQGYEMVYGCQLRVVGEEGKRKGTVTILATRIPKAWETQEDFDEPVGVRGVLVQVDRAEQRLVLLSDRLSWYPVTGVSTDVSTNVSTGQILLARHGMDVALLDDVVHGRAFVPSSVSREGEAFFSVLEALGKVDAREVFRLAGENVGRVADEWLARQPGLRREHERLLKKLAGETDDEERERLQREIRSAKRRRGIAAAVVDRGGEKLSSVAPLFLQPEEEVGELVIFEGIARRAVRISATERPELQGYFEVEVFTSDSQNLPITFCVRELPADFPRGDAIRERVRIAGVFFKSWRYRSRGLVNLEGGASGNQRARTTPLVVGKGVVWLRRTTIGSSRWAFWGGVFFLGVMGLIWFSMARLARRDRLARAAMNRGETTRLPP